MEVIEPYIEEVVDYSNQQPDPMKCDTCGATVGDTQSPVITDTRYNT